MKTLFLSLLTVFAAMLPSSMAADIQALRSNPDVSFEESENELTIYAYGQGYLEMYVNGRYAGTGEDEITYVMQRQSSDDFHVSVQIITHYNGYSYASYFGYDSRYDDFSSTPMLYASETEHGKGLKINIGADVNSYYNSYFWTDGFDYLWPEYCDYRINGSGDWTRGEMGDSFYLSEYGDYTIEAYGIAGDERTGNSGIITVDVHYGTDGFFSRSSSYIVYNGLYCSNYNYDNNVVIYLSQNDPEGDLILPNLSDIVIPASFVIGGDEYTVANVNRSNCNDATSITCLSATPIDADLIYDESDPFAQQVTLFVPQEGLDAYKAHEQWGKFVHIVPFVGAGPGDVDGDGVINIDDVTNLIDQLLFGEELPAYIDVDGDGAVDINDVTTLIDMLLGIR